MLGCSLKYSIVLTLTYTFDVNIYNSVFVFRTYSCNVNPLFVNDFNLPNVVYQWEPASLIENCLNYKIRRRTIRYLIAISRCLCRTNFITFIQIDKKKENEYFLLPFNYIFFPLKSKRRHNTIQRGKKFYFLRSSDNLLALQIAHLKAHM